MNLQRRQQLKSTVYRIASNTLSKFNTDSTLEFSVYSNQYFTEKEKDFIRREMNKLIWELANREQKMFRKAVIGEAAKTEL